MITLSNTIQEVKNDILFGLGDRCYVRSEIDRAMEYVLAVKLDGQGFGQQVAETVSRFKKCSEKQAWVIAKTFVEQNLNNA